MAFNYPWTNLHELNLNWILSQIKQITRQIANFAGLTATAHTLPQNEDPTVTLTGGTGNTPYNFDFGIPASPSSTVSTVNGQSGDVVLTASDIGLGNVDNVQQYSATNPPPYPVTSVNGMTGDVIVSGGGGGGDVLSVNGKNGVVVLDKTDIGLGNVDNIQQYSATNPPPYPVTSVNGQTGDVTISGDVDSVNGQTGVVVLGAKQTAPIIPVSGTGVVLNHAEYIKIGNLITYTFEFTTPTAQQGSVLTRFELPAVGTNVPYMPAGSVVDASLNTYLIKLYTVNGSISVVPTILPAGTYQGCITYITAS